MIWKKRWQMFLPMEIFCIIFCSNYENYHWYFPVISKSLRPERILLFIRNYPHHNLKLLVLLVYFACELTQHTLKTQIKTVTCNFNTLCVLVWSLSLLKCVVRKLVSHNSLLSVLLIILLWHGLRLQHFKVVYLQPWFWLFPIDSQLGSSLCCFQANVAKCQTVFCWELFHSLRTVTRSTVMHETVHC